MTFLLSVDCACTRQQHMVHDFTAAPSCSNAPPAPLPPPPLLHLPAHPPPQAKDCMSYLKLVANLRDDPSLDRIINKPTRGLGACSDILHGYCVLPDWCAWRAPSCDTWICPILDIALVPGQLPTVAPRALSLLTVSRAPTIGPPLCTGSASGTSICTSLNNAPRPGCLQHLMVIHSIRVPRPLAHHASPNHRRASGDAPEKSG